MSTQFKPWSPPAGGIQPVQQSITTFTPSTTPTVTTSLTTAPDADKFVVCCGAAFSGKTTFALTFPNPIVLDFDRKIPKAGVKNIEFWNESLIRQLAPQANTQSRYVNRRDALQNWLIDNIGKYTDHTGILDSLSNLETAFHQQTEFVEGIKANVGGGQLFGRKMSYMCDIFALMKDVFGRVVINVHLAPIVAINPTTGTDQATGKFKPACSGSFAERIPTFATSILFLQRETTTPDFSKPSVTKYLAYLRPTVSFEYAGVLNLTPDGPSKLENPTHLSFCQAVGLTPQ